MLKRFLDKIIFKKKIFIIKYIPYPAFSFIEIIKAIYIFKKNVEQKT